MKLQIRMMIYWKVNRLNGKQKVEVIKLKNKIVNDFYILCQILGAIVEASPIISNDNSLPTRFSRSLFRKIEHVTDEDGNLIS